MMRYGDTHADVAVLSCNFTHRPDVVIPILRSGVLAETFCRDVSRANVEAVFERCFYLRHGDEFVCIGEPWIAHGPLTLTGNLGLLSDLGLRPGQMAEVCQQHIAIGNSVRFELEQTRPWRRPPWPKRAPPGRLYDTCSALAERSARDAPPEGLARCVTGISDAFNCRSPLARLAQPRIVVFERWLSRVLEAQTTSADASQKAIRNLIGLGPGLTPSGDDYLVGALAMLDAVGQHNIHTALARVIIDVAPGLTTPLSACFLRAAAGGRVGETLHRVVSSIITGDVDAAVTAADKIGHSSGWDMLAGAMTALRTTVAARRKAPSAQAFALS